MTRKNFIAFSGASLAISGVLYYLSTDKSNFVRADIRNSTSASSPLGSEEREILYLASLAPSGHNTQPWFVKYIEPFHWIVCNDKSKWLLGVDPTQRETIMSIGAFLQNMEYAASNLGYTCQFTVLAVSSQDEDIVDVKLTYSGSSVKYDIQKILQRRTVRSNYLNDILEKADVSFLLKDETEFIHYLPNTSEKHQWLNQLTIEANLKQTYRNESQHELADWIRFSSTDAKIHCDGLTMASMEIEGASAWYLRNVYTKGDVIKKSFRKKSIDIVKKQVANSGGWLLISSNDNSVASLLETGKRFQRLLLKIRERSIAIHPMTQVLEESAISQIFNSSIGINGHIQFILRVGYIKSYPQPVSLRRPVDWFVRL